jgi:polysaccharidase protein
MSTFYVDSRTGSDANNGSAATPWASIDAVNGAGLKAGDTVLFARDATFHGTIDLHASGTAGAPITFGAYGTGADPLITGGNNGVSGNGEDFIAVRDLHISGVNGAGIISFDSNDWTIDNVHVDHAGGGWVPGNNDFSAFQFRGVSNLTIENSSYDHITGDGVFLWEANGVKILNNDFETPQGATADNIHTYQMHDYEVRGNTLSFADATDSGKGNMVVQESSNGTIADNTFLMGSAHYGIGGTIQNGVIEDNHFVGRKEGEWSTGLNITETLGSPSNVDHMTIQHNFFDGSGMGIYTWDGNGAGTAFRNDLNITDNIFKDLRDPAIVAESPVQLNGTYADNTLVNTADPNWGGTTGSWSDTNNVHSSEVPAWTGGADGNTPVEAIAGTNANDTLTGTDGADTIWGDTQQDGPAGGNDILNGGAGNDYLSGGPGADIYVGAPGGGVDTIRWFESGADKIDVSQFGWTSLADMQSAGVVMTPGTATDGVPLLTVDFGHGDGFTVGGVNALTEADLVFSGSNGSAPATPATTALDGTAGDDALQGTAAAETIDGKGGNDTLTGGAGADVFVFGQGYGTATVTDFDGTTDKVDLKAFGLHDMTGLAAAATVTTGTNDVVLNFASGDQLTLAGITKLTADQVVF